MFVLKGNEWDLEKTIKWYHASRNDPDMPIGLKAVLYNDGTEDESGKIILMDDREGVLIFCFSKNIFNS